MAKDKPYTVFTQNPQQEPMTPGFLADEWWQAHGPISARSEPAAIEKLRDMDPDLKANADVEYFAVAGLRPRKMIRQIIEKFALGFADEDTPAGDRQGSLDRPRDGREGS